jgi:hypothetical protein
MKQLMDQHGHPVSVGDTIVHVTKRSTDVSISYGFIYGLRISQRKGHYKLLVILGDCRYNYTADKFIFRARLATLTANNFLKADIPDDTKIKLMDRVP